MAKRYKLKKEGVNMSNNYKSLNLSKLKNKENVIVSSRDALKDVTPINWSKEVITGKKKITVG